MPYAFLVCCVFLGLVLFPWHVVQCLRCGPWRPSLVCLVVLLCAASRLIPLLSTAPVIFPIPEVPPPYQKLMPLDLLDSCAMHAEAGQELGSCRLRVAPATAGALGSLRVAAVRSSAIDLSRAGLYGVLVGLHASMVWAC